jgi:DNA-binding MarR family transcriptional regulator
MTPTATSAPRPTATAGREQANADVRAAFGELMAAERRLRGRKSDTDGGLSYGQVRALFTLEREERATAGQLAKAADLTPGTMTALLDQLERDGMVQRTRSTDDRRVVYVSLTPAGRTELHTKRTRWQRLWEEELQSLSDDDLRVATDVMRRIARVLDTL